MRILIVAAGLAFIVAGCARRPTPEQCQEICWKYNELNYWQAFEDRTKDLGPAEKESAREASQKAWDDIEGRNFDPGLKNCITSCKRGGKASMVECMEKAESAAAARVCLKD